MDCSDFVLAFQYSEILYKRKKNVYVFLVGFPTVLFQRRSLYEWFTDTSHHRVEYIEAFGQLELI
jgi:hypothetical protein